MDDLMERLPGYDRIGRGRDAGGGGEYSAIFYRPDRVELLETETFWLSETPEVPGSRSWDAAIQRIVTWGKFRHRESGREFFHFNTHFDHVGEQSRRQSARLLLERMAEVAGDAPVVLTGDLNATPDSAAYRILTGAASASGSVFCLHDAALAGAGGEPEGTFSSFDTSREPGPRIDYVMVAQGIVVESFASIVSVRDQRYPSDHLPLTATLAFRGASGN